MNKKILIVIIIILAALPLAWYTLSPFWRTVELNEPSPSATGLVKDNLDVMDEQQRMAFDAAINSMKSVVMPGDEAMPTNTRILAEGEFRPRAHDVKGKAFLLASGGKKLLRFEDFETINGPNLHIYLSSELGASDFVDLGKIRATKGNVNYEVPSTTDTTRYRKVLVWCVPFGVLFSYAELK